MLLNFEYRARDAVGAVRTGVLAAASSGAAAKDIAGMGWVPLDIRARAAAYKPVAGTDISVSARFAVLVSRFKTPNQKRLQEALGLVLRELAALLRAGVPLMRALQLCSDSCAQEPVRALLQRISRDLDNGHNLVAAAEREHRTSGLITTYDVAMLQVGDKPAACQRPLPTCSVTGNLCAPRMNRWAQRCATRPSSS